MSKGIHKLRSRIVEMRNVKASELVHNEKNWRLHPDDQRGGLSAMLEKIGFVSPVVARETEDGLELIDGHLRTTISGNEEIPVVIVDLTDEEAAEVLITFDPLGGLAEFDAKAMSDLIGEVDLDDNAYTRKLIQDMQNELIKKEEKKDKNKDDDGEHTVPDLELHPHEHYDYIVVLATNTAEWNVLCELLNLKPNENKHRKRMGVCRAIHAHKVIETIKSDYDA